MPGAGRGKEKPCPFCPLAAAEPGAGEVLREDGIFAFLDHRPLIEGHVLVCPTRHVETVLDLAPEHVGPLFVAARRVAKAMESAFEADGALIVVNNRVSQSVPHLHVHVVPRQFGDGLFGKPFFWARRKYPNEEASSRLAARLREALSGLDDG